MINFFRKLRRTSLVKNSSNDLTSRAVRYLLYGVGEIVLVVIGILIALNVNNHNHEKQSRIEEAIILRNLKEDLNLDTLDISFNIEYHQAFITEEKKLLNFLQSDLAKPALPIDYDGALSTPLLVILHQSTFDNLQNNEVGLISNTDLRKKIARFYDFFATGIQIIENDLPAYETYETKFPYFLKYCRLDPTAPSYVLSNPDNDDYFKDDFRKQPLEMIDFEGAKNDEAFKIVLNESIFFRNIMIKFYIDTLNRIKALNQAIDDELSILEKS